MNNCFGGDNNCLWILVLLTYLGGDNNDCLCDILPILLLMNACGGGHFFGNIGNGHRCGCNG